MQGAILQMINHGLITGALFLLVGVIYERTHDRTIAKMGGLAALMPVYVGGLRVLRVRSAGLPGLAGFVGEFLMLVGAFVAYPWVAAVAAFVMMLGAAYLLWMFQRIVFGDVSPFFRELGHHLTDMTPTEMLTLAPLVALVVAFGLFPGLLLDLIPLTVAATVESADIGQVIAIPTEIVLIALGLLLAFVVGRIVYVAVLDHEPAAEPAPGAGGAA